MRAKWKLPIYVSGLARPINQQGYLWSDLVGQYRLFYNGHKYLKQRLRPTQLKWKSSTLIRSQKRLPPPKKPTSKSTRKA